MALVPPSARREQPFHNGCGIGIYGPAIDEYGNSLTGGMLLKHIAQEWELSIF
ncbi:glutaminase [Pseudomonas sp. L1(2025)]